ncbi:MAG: gephyrin-like molybdotransferase Glp [Dethiobacteria bacterium]|jgi:molybdopterin molybdotransferase|nr:molybdopterin molybdotransferase MoeA [Bacillota bacterium]
MICLEEAQQILHDQLQHILFPRVERVPLWEAGGRVLAMELVAEEDVPRFDRSLVDGFALFSADTAGAAAENSVALKITASIAAGSSLPRSLEPGTAMKIFTGAPLPWGADSVIKKEEVVERAAEDGNSPMVIVKRPVAPGEGVALRGEDISAGERLLSYGTVISSAHLGILATLGVDPVPVYAKPQIGIFSTGDELVDVKSPLKHGQLRASNIYTLAGIVRQAGGIPVSLGLVKDRVESVVQAYHRARELGLPMVISTGGTASGDYDVIKEAMEKVSASRLFDKVAIRPGAPLIASLREEQLLVALSGNPSGAAVTMLLLLFPLIARLAGTHRELACEQARLAKPLVRKSSGVRSFLWGNCFEQEGCLFVAPLDNQFCGAIKSFAGSNCLVEIPAGKVDYPVNALVAIRRLP